MKIFLTILVFLFFPTLAKGGNSAPQKTIIKDFKEAELLLGRHLVASYWLSSDGFGPGYTDFAEAIITNEDGVYKINIDQNCYHRRPRSPKDIAGGYVKIKGIITEIDTEKFTIHGTLKTFYDWDFSWPKSPREKCSIKTDIVYSRTIDPESEDPDFEEHWDIYNIDHIWEACNEQISFPIKIYTKKHEGSVPNRVCAPTLKDAANLPMY